MCTAALDQSKGLGGLFRAARSSAKTAQKGVVAQGIPGTGVATPGAAPVHALEPTAPNIGGAPRPLTGLQIDRR